MQLNQWTKDLADIRHRLGIAISVLAVNHATRAAEAHLRLFAAIHRFEGNSIDSNAFATEMRAIQQALTEVREPATAAIA
jgi:DNA-binding FadR family transcriptional regulator